MSTKKIQPGRAAVMHLLGIVHDLAGKLDTRSTPVDIATVGSQQTVMVGLATANALLAIETRLAELVEQQKVANVMAIQARSSAIGLDYETDEAADAFLRDRLAGLLKAAESGA